MSHGPSPREQMLDALPSLRAFAISLSGGGERADDLVQDTLTKALANLDRFEPGTNMVAWLITILRNRFYSELRRRRREVEDPGGDMAARLAVLPDQGARLDVKDLVSGLTRLTTDQREALLLVSAEGFSYEEAARICGTEVGTVKSRVSRARRRLATLLAIDRVEDLTPDPSSNSAWLAAARA